MINQIQFNQALDLLLTATRSSYFYHDFDLSVRFNTLKRRRMIKKCTSKMKYRDINPDIVKDLPGISIRICNSYFEALYEISKSYPPKTSSYGTPYFLRSAVRTIAWRIAGLLSSQSQQDDGPIMLIYENNKVIGIKTTRQGSWSWWGSWSDKPCRSLQGKINYRIVKSIKQNKQFQNICKKRDQAFEMYDHLKELQIVGFTNDKPYKITFINTQLETESLSNFWVLFYRERSPFQVNLTECMNFWKYIEPLYKFWTDPKNDTLRALAVLRYGLE